MGVLIKGGTIVTAERTYRGDIYTEGETIKAIGEGELCLIDLSNRSK